MIENRVDGEAGGLRASVAARMLAPRSIAIIGISSRPGSAGQITLSNLLKDKYPAEIHLMGRGGGEIGGRKVAESLNELPDGIDLAILTLPAVAVREAIEGCAAKGFGGVLVFASGFAETGEEARAEQAAISAFAEESGIGVVGPNCLGFSNFVQNLEVGFMPAAPMTAPSEADGAVILSQSGGLMGLISDGLSARRVPILYRISVGNEAGLGLSDFLVFMARQPLVRTIVVYAEHIRKPQAFLTAARQARAAGKSVVLLHTGRGAKAQRAAASHTGALAGDFKIMAAHVRYAGVVLAESIDELVDCAELVHRVPTLPVAGPAVVTTSGAFCAIAHDCFEDIGLALPDLSPESRAVLTPRLPGFTPPQNPLDLTTQPAWEPELIADSIVQLDKDPTLGSITIALPTGPEAVALRWFKPLAEALPRLTKPIQLSLFNDVAPVPQDFVDAVRDAGLPLNVSPERAMRAIARLTMQGRIAAQGHAADADTPYAGLPDLRPGIQPEWLGKKLLKAIGISTPEGALVTSPDEAVAVAERIGYPVVLKVQAAALAHKTEIGGVVLNLGSADALRGAYAELEARIRKVRPDVMLDGMLVEKMSGKGLELVVGATRDPHWGATLMVGIGGIFIEALQDVRLLPAGLDEAAILAELEQLKLAALLGEFRGAPAPDVAAVAHAVAALGRLMNSRPDIVEVDINPLVALPAGQGVIALDALIITNEAGE